MNMKFFLQKNLSQNQKILSFDNKEDIYQNLSFIQMKKKKELLFNIKN